MFRFNLDTLQTDTDNRFDLGELAGKAAGRLGEGVLSAFRGALAIPAGIERLIIDPIFPGEQDAVRAAMERSEYAQQTLRNDLGLDESAITNFIGEMAGAIAIGAPVLKTGKFLVNRLPGAFKLINPESAKFAAAAIGAEGGLFVAGLDEEATTTSILGATILGAGIGGGVTKLIHRSAAKRAAKLGDDVTTLSVTSETAAEVQSNIRLTASIPDDTLAMSDEAIAGIRATLSESGESGAILVSRATRLGEPALARLRGEFPALRFEQVGDDVIHGLKPGTKLPEGTTRSAGVLTDDVLAEFQRTGQTRGQRMLLDGQQEVTLVDSKGKSIKINIGSGQTQIVPIERLSRATGEVGGALENPRLLDEFIKFKNERSLDNVDQAIKQFVAQLDDVVPAQRPHLTQYLSEQVAKREAALLRPDERAALEKFITARRASILTGRTTSMEEVAAAKGHSVVRETGGRVLLTDMTTGQTYPVFGSQQEAKAFLDALEVAVPDLTPAIEGIPQELLRGVAFTGVPLNPAIDAGEEIITKGLQKALAKGPNAVRELMYSTAGRWLRGVEAAALDIERRGHGAIWSEHIQPLSFKLTRAMNRGNRMGRRFNANGVLGKLTETELDLVEKWLRSEAKQTFEATSGMSPALIKKAEHTRKLLVETFDELSAQSGTTLSVENYFRNYVPDMLESVARRGERDLIAARALNSQDVPSDLRFWNEMFKSGEIGLLQAPLNVKINRMIRSGYRKAFAGEEFEAARKALSELDSADAKRTLADYLTGVMGNGDATREVLQSVTAEFYRNMGITVPPGQLGNIVDDMVGASYSALMGFRVQLALRNHTQMFNLLGPLIGQSRVVRAYVKAGKIENYEWALRIGAVRDQLPVTHAELLNLKGSARRNAVRKLERMSLRMYTKADEHNRAVAAVAMRDVMETYLPKLASGEMGAQEFGRKTGLSFFDETVQTAFHGILEGTRTVGTIGDTAAERATNFIAREMSNTTNFLYGAANSPAWVRTAPGKIAGSYSTFTFGYANYLQTMLRNGSKGEKVSRLAKHGLFNYALVSAGAVVGLDLTRWVAGSSINYIGGTGWVGGPQVDLVIDATKSIGGAPWERERARKNLKRNVPGLLIPGARFARDIWTAGTYLADDRPEAAAAAALGFKLSNKPEPANLPPVVLP